MLCIGDLQAHVTVDYAHTGTHQSCLMTESSKQFIKKKSLWKCDTYLIVLVHWHICEPNPSTMTSEDGIGVRIHGCHRQSDEKADLSRCVSRQYLSILTKSFGDKAEKMSH